MLHRHIRDINYDQLWMCCYNGKKYYSVSFVRHEKMRLNYLQVQCFFFFFKIFKRLRSIDNDGANAPKCIKENVTIA